MKRLNRPLRSTAMLAVGFALINLASASTRPQEIVLFDGSNKESFSPLQGFTFSEGLLKGKGRLRSAKQYSNYELHMEIRFTQHYGNLSINHIGFNPIKGVKAPVVGQWMDLHALFRYMPGEAPSLSVPQINFQQRREKGKHFDDRNLVAAEQLPRKANGWIKGQDTWLDMHFTQPVEIRRITLRPLDPSGPREYFELEGEAYTQFLNKGKEVYSTYCIACHGDGTGAAPSPINRSLGTEAMQNGSDRLSLYDTLTKGYKLMAAAPHLTDIQRHQTAAYVSDVLFKHHNPSQYKPTDPALIETMPYGLYSAQDEFDRRNKPEEQIKKERGTFRDHGPVVVSCFGKEYRNAANLLLDANTAISYDLYGMNQINTRTDGFLDMFNTHYFKQRGESIVQPAGHAIPELTTWFWRMGNSLAPPAKNLRNGPNQEVYSFNGYYLHNRQAILSYAVKGRGILERPSLAMDSNRPIILQQLVISPGNTPLQLALAGGVTREPVGEPETPHTIQGKTGDLSLAILGHHQGLSYSLESGVLLLNIPASAQAIEFTVARAAGSVKATALSALPTPSPLDHLLKGGERRWPKAYTAAGTLSPDSSAYVMDTLPVPYENDYNAWMRTTSVAFFPDGRAVVTTHGGDVWIVSGIDKELKAVTWSRFAAGLYQAFGVKVIDGLIYVTTRNGIVRLHDINQNGEADFYEQFFSDPEVAAMWHGYNFDLIHDKAGYFYYAKSGQFTDIIMEGGVLQVSPDGKRYKEFATGFRTPNGMGLLPDGRITYGENQGGWVPAGKVSIVEEGSWHGGAVRSSPVDRKPAPSLINLPQDVDNSCGGQLWIDDARFGPYANKFMHTSSGHARAMMLFIDELGETSQAATQPFPFKFDSGVMRLATNPQDGQVYLTGTRGWQINAPKDGNLQRIRYTGKGEALLMDVKARSGGITLHFNEAIDPANLKVEQFSVSSWNYKRAKAYGSRDYKPSQPTVVGRDTWSVSELRLSPDKKSVQIVLPEIMPAHQVKVTYQVGFISGSRINNTVHLTVHALE